MATCLGLYIEDHVIKYAKITKDNNIIKIDSFGVKFYEKLNDAIAQVIEETYSYKTPISINLSGETYNYFYLFSLLNKKDIQNVISTEFESICYDKGLNKDAFEARYVIVDDLENKDKVKAIHVSANKADIAKKEQQLDGYKIIAESPIGTSIGNLLEYKEKENCIIVNIEENTTITTIIDKKIVDVQTIDEGSDKILSSINDKENSYSKAYEICKNSTIYTQEGKDLQYEENEYLDYIMPTLYNIVGRVRSITESSINRIDKVYITGTASVINNIDIYFQEYLRDIKCEILKPYFINNAQAKINIKDYIEVNSAIALALQGLGEGIKGLNFKKASLMDKLPEWLTADVGGKTGKLKDNKKSKKNWNFNLNFDFKAQLTALERNLIRSAIAILILIVAYGSLSIYLNVTMNKKEKEIASAKDEVNSQIAAINTDISKIKEITSEYQDRINQLQQNSSKAYEKNKRKNSIPTLLNQIMSVIPKEVQLTSIENSGNDTIVINAQSKTYEPLGYFLSKIKEDDILFDVISNSGVKDGQEGWVSIVIRGNLPIE